MAADEKIQKLSIDTIRALAMDAVQKANAGHPGTAMALAPRGLRALPARAAAQPDRPGLGEPRPLRPLGRARGDAPVRRPHLTGYNLSLEELKRFRQWQSRTPGTRSTSSRRASRRRRARSARGSRTASASRSPTASSPSASRPHAEIVDRFVYAICSDGDLMEGVSYEAASIAGHLGLGRLVYFYDDNHITIDGTTSLTFTTEDKAKRFEAQGWHVQSIADSEDVAAIERAIRGGAGRAEAPSLIIVRSHIAYGAPKAVDTAKSHGSPLGEEVAATKQALGLDPDKHFDVAPEVYEHMDMRPQGIARQQEWQRVRALGGGVPGAEGGMGRRPHRRSRARAGSRPSPSSRRARPSPAATPARR